MEIFAEVVLPFRLAVHIDNLTHICTQFKAKVVLKEYFDLTDNETLFDGRGRYLNNSSSRNIFLRDIFLHIYIAGVSMLFEEWWSEAFIVLTRASVTSIPLGPFISLIQVFCILQKTIYISPLYINKL